MASQKQEDGPLPTIALLAQRVAGAILGVVQPLLRTARDALSSTLATPAKRLRRPSKAGADAVHLLRAISGGAGRGARRNVDASRESEATTRGSSPLAELDDDLDVLGAAIEEDGIVVLPRDPCTVFAYWQLTSTTSARRAQLRGEVSGVSHDALLVHVTGGDPASDESWLVALPPLAESCYVDLLRPRTSTQLVLGVCNESASFVALVTSAPILLPEAGCAAILPPRWRRLASADEATGEPPATPTRETSDLLFARALASEHASSDAVRPHHVLQVGLGDPVGQG